MLAAFPCVAAANEGSANEGSDPGLTPSAKAQKGSDPGQTPLVGQVLDGRTGEPLDRVRVVVEDTGKSTLTGPDGAFRIDGLAPGTHRLYVSVVGYALYRGEVTAGVTPVIFRLAEGTTAYNESLTVTGATFRSPQDPVPSASVLGSAELLNLRGVLADDPLRAVQVLPGVATGDDLRSEFTVRGSDFRHLTFTVDGFSTPYLVHTVRGVEDRGPTGSVAMINSDVLEDVTLLNGGFPQRFSGHTGAEVDFRLREGSRDRRIFRAAVSGTSASIIAEGPIGRRRRGAWLIAGRQSYIDHLVHHLTERSVSFGFADAQARVAYDLSASHHVDVTLLTGHSRFLNEPGEHDIDDVYDARNAAVVGVGSWRITTPRLILSQRILAAENHFRNENQSDVELDKGKDRQLAYRADATFVANRALEIDAGGEAERRDDSRIRRRLAANSISLAQLDDYTANALSSGAYALFKWTSWPGFIVAPGLRVDHWSLTDQSTTSPWIQTEWRTPGDFTLRAAAGRHQQFADFDKVRGASAGANLVPERADQFDVGIERRLSSILRVSATFYDREERRMLRQPGNETRVVNGRVVRRLASSKYENRLDGFARGVELMIQRKVAGAGLSGWISYAYGRNRYRDVVSNETFWGDNDQRHTLNAYALYRHSDRVSFVAKLRLGSNFPIPGYFTKLSDPGVYLLSDTRNTERLPLYGRLDLRANRAFNWSRRRLTVFAEVINVLNRANVRFDPPLISVSTRAVSQPFDSMFPIIPSVGVLIDF